jgi:hypothetical protein
MKQFMSFIVKSAIKIILIIVISTLLKSTADAATSTGINYVSVIAVIGVVIWDAATSFSE